MQAVARPGDPDDHQPLGHQGRHLEPEPARALHRLAAELAREIRGGLALALLRAHRLLVPDHPPGLGVERDQASVHGRLEHEAVRDRDPAVGGRTENLFRARLMRVAPERPTRAGIERRDVVLGRRNVERAVDHHRLRLEIAGHPGLEQKGGPQAADAGPVDLGQVGEVAVAVVVTEGRPRGLGGDGRER